MSKLTKLIKYPILVIKDSKVFGKSKVKGVFMNVKTILSAVLNKIMVTNISLVGYEVGLYFAGSMKNIYQIEQWLKVLKELDKRKKIAIIVRNKEVYDWVEQNTDFTCIYCKTIDDLLNVYENNNFKCILYVNNGFKNFQSLINNKALHVHINHGESEKVSTFSNQAKAYDYVFIVGDAAFDKYNLNLIKKDMNKFIKVGRPQLEWIEKALPIPQEKLMVTVENEVIKKRKVVLYAPTWEGTHEAMNYSSLEKMGRQIIQFLLNEPNYYVIYKPHPNTGSRSKIIDKINKEIIKLLENSEKGHVVLEGDINSLYEHVDIAIFDNSAVAIDYLYVDKPMIMTDMFHKAEKTRINKPIITKCARLINENDVFYLNLILEKEINEDPLKNIRKKIKNYYLGDFNYHRKESTKMFISKIMEIIKERDELLKELEQINEKHSYTNII